MGPCCRPGSRGLLVRAALVLLCLLLLLGVAWVGHGEESATVAALIHQLGSDDFDRRELASKALAERGEEALPFLRAAVRSPDAEIRRRSSELVDLIERRTFGEMAVLVGHGEGLWSATFSPDGKLAATCSDDKTLRLWLLASGRQIGLIGAASAVNCARFFRDGKRLLIGLASGELAIRDTTGKLLQTIGKHGDEIVGLALLPGEQEAITVGRDGTLKRWRLSDAKLVRTFVGHSAMIRNVAVTADGRSAATASFDGTIRVWDLDSGELLRTLDPGGGMAFGVGFSPDGKQLATGTADHLVRLWDVASGEEVQRFAGHTGFVYGTVILPGGRRLLSVSEDGSARVWNIATGAEVRAFRGHTDYIRSVEVAPDGRSFLTASKDRTARLWHVPRE